ncbi:L,D-transpeptidase [Actinomycetospora cinnamomea]|uniref:L,D-transpeptidase-like protein n=1 Tax=Actinomycetospora cinnamomea TaxID=663609 RepID=A0A2U1EVG9_9PSEU|nr:L,D-transpeptidase [Actinomycetospora cinnamomea]PVZ03926.1 L,D-transpeptidase-like protein [Actinomycetospora cinnamomea]
MARHRRHHARTPRTLAPLGLAAVATLGAAAPATAAPATAAPSSLPCDDTADVCVDLSAHRAWLTDDGRATSPSMRITAGSAEDPTPTGTFAVQRKERHHVSQEIEGAPMPYAVFFDDEGRAFHGGETDGASHGCIHLEPDDAREVFAALEPGDEVEIVR